MLAGIVGLPATEVPVGLESAAEDAPGPSIFDLLADWVGTELVKLTDGAAEGLLLGLDPLADPLGQKVTVLRTF